MATTRNVKKDTPSITDLSVSDLLRVIQENSKVKRENQKCILIRKIEEGNLPENIKEAIYLALGNSDISNIDILSFMKDYTTLRVNLKNVMLHRRKKGCLDCDHGGTNL